MGDAIGRPCAFRYGALTLCGPVFNPVPLTHGFLQLPAGPSEPAHAIPQHPARNPRRVSHAQGLAIIRFRSPLLTEYPFLQVLRCFTSLRTPRPKPVPTHDGRWVPPFGNPRIKALLAAPRGISQPQTSFIGTVCQGIHHTPLQATHTTKVHGRKIPLANSQTTNHHTKNDHKTIETNNRVRFEINSKTKIQKPLFCSRPLSSSQATTHRHAIAPAHGRPPGTTGIESRQAKSLGWRSGSPKAHPYHPGTHRTTGGAKPTTSSTPATPPPSHHATRGAHTVGRTSDCILRRKEVIQPHLPVRLPCYDLVPITSLTLDGSIPQGVRPPASGAAHFHDLTGGVYKARERIHRDVADSRLLATPPSRSRVADCDPN